MIEDPQTQIILATRNRLIEKITEASNISAWIDDAPLPLGKDAPPQINSFSLMIGDGNFDSDWGGNLCAVREHSSIIITHLFRTEFDVAKQLTQAIAASQKSMMKMKRNILTAMLVEQKELDPIGNPGVISTYPWRPVGQNDAPLFDQFLPGTVVSPKRHKDWPLLYQYIEFRFSFFWQL